MRTQTGKVHIIGLKLLSWVQGFRLRSVFLWKLKTFLGCHQSCLSLQIINNFWDQLPGTCTFRPRTILFTGCWLCPNSICHWFTPWLKSPAVKGYVNLNCVKELSQHMWSPKACCIVEPIAWTLGLTGFEFESWFFQVPAGRCWARSLTSLSLNSFIIEMSGWLSNKTMYMKALCSTLNHVNTTCMNTTLSRVNYIEGPKQWSYPLIFGQHFTF